MIAITGAGGFIGSCLVRELNRRGVNELYLVDMKESFIGNKNLEGARCKELIEPNKFIKWLYNNKNTIDTIIHLGGISATDVTDIDMVIEQNYKYTMDIYKIANKNRMKFIYASSATTYGDGSHGFSDEMSMEMLKRLEPTTIYGKSKHMCDMGIIEDVSRRSRGIIGLKFFNVYGPNEYHKGNMSSAIMRMYNQIKDNKDLVVFKSNREIERDFVYIKDVIKIIMFFMKRNIESGIYNVGSGVASSFQEVARLVIDTIGKDVEIVEKQMKQEMEERYQYYTCAELKKLRRVGYLEDTYSLRRGVEEYINEYLKLSKHY